MNILKSTIPVPKHPKFHLPGLWRDLQKRGKKPELQITSLPSLDRKIWGITRQEMVVLAARTSQGKTALALQIAWDLASQGKSVVYLSLEMTVTALLERLFCYSEGIDNSSLLVGKFNDYPEQKASFEKKIEDMPLLITQGLGKNWKEINDFISLINPKPDCLIMDYIGCIEGGRVDRKVINDYIYRLRAEAVKHDFAVILLSQVNRASIISSDNRGKIPSLEGLKETGALEEHADKVILLHYPYFYNQNVDSCKYKIHIAKNRNGRTGVFSVYFDATHYRFIDLERIQEDPQVAKAAGIFGGDVVG